MWWRCSSGNPNGEARVVNPPQILILRFARYHDSPSGATKNHALITWTSAIQLLIFTGAHVDFANCAYTVEAAILHTGLSSTTGQYTTLLFEAGTAYFVTTTLRHGAWVPAPIFALWLQRGLLACLQARGGALRRAIGPSLLHHETPVTFCRSDRC